MQSSGITGLSDTTGLIGERRFGGREDCLVLRMEDGVLLITAVGAPVGALIVEAVETGMREGWLKNPTPTLVDVRDYDGRVDWQSLRAISKMAPWGSLGGSSAQVAYLSRDPLFILVIKAVSVLFPGVNHRILPDPATAMTWLRAASDG